MYAPTHRKPDAVPAVTLQSRQTRSGSNLFGALVMKLTRPVVRSRSLRTLGDTTHTLMMNRPMNADRDKNQIVIYRKLQCPLKSLTGKGQGKHMQAYQRRRKNKNRLRPDARRRAHCRPPEPPDTIRQQPLRRTLGDITNTANDESTNECKQRQ
ncbi:hypothetical protein U9M48_001488 [Paspalum notatum var. saurae]|uniref:Uncharacterized protein n=1 Tax=Paspalum notatum var. saurae TaxID=547442 RepID=A0AAQ3SCZ2_PASNO